MKRDSDRREETSRITVGDLRRMLSGLPDHMEITFGSTVEAVPLAFHRLKRRGPKLLQIELSELFPDDSGVTYLEEVAKGDWRRARPQPRR